MSNGFWMVIALLGVFAVFTVAKIYSYMRESEEQWRNVDKSKLRSWDDDED